MNARAAKPDVPQGLKPGGKQAVTAQLKLCPFKSTAGAIVFLAMVAIVPCVFAQKTAGKTQAASAAFAPVEQWKAAVLAGDAGSCGHCTARIPRRG